MSTYKHHIWLELYKATLMGLADLDEKPSMIADYAAQMADEALKQFATRFPEIAL